MKFLSLIFFVYFTVINLTNGAHISEGCGPDKLKVELYYETLCPYCKNFISNQLYPAVKGNDWLPFIDLEFIPYGKVSVSEDQSNNSTKLSCQHGELECELNALHACIVENNSVEEQLEIFNCLVDKPEAVDDCAQKLNIDVSAAKDCKNTRSIADILKKYGEKTHAVNPKFVPSVALGGHFDQSARKEIVYNFSREFCRKYKDTYGIALEKC